MECRSLRLMEVLGGGMLNRFLLILPLAIPYHDTLKSRRVFLEGTKTR